MNPTKIISMILLALAAFALLALFRPQITTSAKTIVAGLRMQFGIGLIQAENTVTLEDAGVETHGATLRYAMEEALTARYLLLKQGSAANGALVCGAAYEPLGNIDNVLASGETGSLRRLGVGEHTTKMIASGAITKGVKVFTDASGKVQAEPAVAGTYYLVGRAFSAALADGDTLEVESCLPLRLVVLALPGNVNSEISALTSSTTTTQAEFNALRDKCEELADDFRAMAAAASTGSLVKWLAS